MKRIISVNNLCKCYKDKKVLDNISFNINENEMVAIVGESGRGKTTLLNILGLVSVQSSGEYKVFDKTVKNINSKEAMLLRRFKIGYLFQNYGLVEEETVEWNIDLAFAYKKISKKEKKERMHDCLKDFSLENLQKKKVFQLSGGEQQRVALIKLIIQDNDIILADEPTGSLDIANRDIVINKLLDLKNRGKTIIIVTHDEYISSRCDRVIRI